MHKALITIISAANDYSKKSNDSNKENFDQQLANLSSKHEKELQNLGTSHDRNLKECRDKLLRQHQVDCDINEKLYLDKLSSLKKDLSDMCKDSFRFIKMFSKSRKNAYY